MARKKKANPAEGARVLAGTLEVVPIDSIKRHAENARKGDVEAIKESILANGFYGRLIVSKKTGEILIGNHRWEAAKDVGMTEIPIERVDVSERTARKMLAADNRTSDLAGYHDKQLAALLKQLVADDDLEGTGYAEKDLDAVVKKLSKSSAGAGFGGLEPGGMHLARKCPRCQYEF